MSDINVSAVLTPTAGRSARRAPVQARTRLVAAVVLAFGFAAVTQAALVPLMLGLALALALGLGVAQPDGRRAPLAALAARLARGLRLPLVLALAALLTLPFLSGSTVIWQAGPLALRAEGLAAGALLAGRLVAIVTVALALLGPVAPMQLVAGMRGLGLPALMADLAALTLRYLDDLRAELARMRLARRLRGGREGWRALGAEGMILAAVLIRSHRRAERIWAAMRLRGHGAASVPPLPAPTGRDRAAMAAAVAVAVAVVVLDRLA